MIVDLTFNFDCGCVVEKIIRQAGSPPVWVIKGQDDGVVRNPLISESAVSDKAMAYRAVSFCPHKNQKLLENS